jgi:hypothetical protein
VGEMRFLHWLRGECPHLHITWPRGRGVLTVSCLDCSRTLPYSWDEMRILSEKEATELRAELHVNEWMEQRRIDSEVERILSR